MTTRQLNNWLKQSSIDVDIVDDQKLAELLKFLSQHMNDKEIRSRLASYVLICRRGRITPKRKIINKKGYLFTFLFQMTRDVDYVKNCKIFYEKYGKLVKNLSDWANYDKMTSNALLWLCNRYLYYRYHLNIATISTRNYYRHLIESNIRKQGYESTIQSLKDLLENLDEQVKHTKNERIKAGQLDDREINSLVKNGFYHKLRELSNG